MTKPIDTRTVTTARKMAAQKVPRPEIARALKISNTSLGRILKDSH